MATEPLELKVFELIKTKLQQLLIGQTIEGGELVKMVTKLDPNEPIMEEGEVVKTPNVVVKTPK